jgi:arabinose-5-phosphate isomerase
MTLVQAMRTDLPILRPDTSLGEAALRMDHARAAMLAVVEDGRVAGSLSALDLLQRVLTGGQNAGVATVGDAMVRNPLCCEPGSTLEQVRALLRTHRQPSVLITEPDGQLVGLIDVFDVLAALDAASAAGPEPDYVKRVRGED